MTPDVVVDIGNSRMKWGLCNSTPLGQCVSLDGDDPTAWQRQADTWNLDQATRWVIASVHPARRERFLHWSQGRGSARCLERAAQLPLLVRLPEPDKVGIDRLLSAVAASAQRPQPGPLLIVSVGTAITVDFVDPENAFCGGAILPGPRLMGMTLHQHTALLPHIDHLTAHPPAPGTCTRAAIELGLYWALVGGANGVLHALCRGAKVPLAETPVFVTGGGADLIYDDLEGMKKLVPFLVLEGIRRSAEIFP